MSDYILKGQIQLRPALRTEITPHELTFVDGDNYTANIRTTSSQRTLNYSGSATSYKHKRIALWSRLDPSSPALKDLCIKYPGSFATSRNPYSPRFRDTPRSLTKWSKDCNKCPQTNSGKTDIPLVLTLSQKYTTVPAHSVVNLLTGGLVAFDIYSHCSRRKQPV